MTIARKGRVRKVERQLMQVIFLFHMELFTCLTIRGGIEERMREGWREEGRDGGRKGGSEQGKRREGERRREEEREGESGGGGGGGERDRSIVV